MTDFSVADHLDDRTQAQLLELAKHATIGSPDSGTGDGALRIAHLMIDLVDNDGA